MTNIVHTSEGSQVPASASLSPAQAALWNTERKLWRPRTTTVTGPWGAAAALTAARPHTAYRKIVDVIADSVEGFSAVVEAAIADRDFVTDTHHEPVVIRFEEQVAARPLDEERREALNNLGFTLDPTPVPSIPSTIAGSDTQVQGWSRWLAESPSNRVPYYGQTTDVTCGAVTALMMFESAGLTKFGSDGDENQAREIAFWRTATNLPACEPVGLAVATQREITTSGLSTGVPRVVLSAPDLVLLEWYEKNPDEFRLREQLQRDSLRQADELGIAIERRWISVEEISTLVANGHDVYLLIALEPLIGDPAPHWILAHDVIGEHLIVSDPWVEAPSGETWVDTSALPIPFNKIDLITRWGDPEYRGVVVVPRS